MTARAWTTAAAALTGALTLALADPAVGQQQRPVLAGQWSFRFQTTVNDGFRGPRVGTVFRRLWEFERSCTDGTCRLTAAREVSDGYRTMRIRRSGSRYVTRMRSYPRCSSGRGRFPYNERISWVITDSVTVGGVRWATELRGRLVGTTPRGGCFRSAARGEDLVTASRQDVPELPAAAFSWTPGVTAAGTSVLFTDESVDSDGEITDRSWNFGDPSSGPANTSTSEQASHVFAAPGQYPVTLTVTDDTGLQSTETKIITINAP